MKYDFLKTQDLEKPFISPSDPMLREVAKPFSEEEVESSSTQELCEAMLNFGYGNRIEQGKSFLVGLAGPQIGISKRIILVDILADGKGLSGELQVYLNPEIIWKSEEKERWQEGCYSVGMHENKQIRGIPFRSTHIRVRATTPEGDVIEEEFHGYVAKIFQHEIDHLDGILFTDHLDHPDQLHLVDEEELPEYRKPKNFLNWSKKCPVSALKQSVFARNFPTE